MVFLRSLINKQKLITNFCTQEYVLKNLTKTLVNNLGFEHLKADDQVKKLNRIKAIDLVCKFGHVTCQNKMREYLSSENSNSSM